MLEFPEAVVVARQMDEMLKGKRIMSVVTQKSPHKFAFFNGDPQSYDGLLTGKVIDRAVQHGGMIQLDAGDYGIVFGDGVNLRYYQEGEKLPDKHQLDVEFEDRSHLIGSVQMYGFIWAFPQGEFDNKYYLIAKEKPSPLSKAFDEAYFTKMAEETPGKLVLKAFLATEQRIPGLGNGVLQDVLFNAGMHPKKKLSTLTQEDKRLLFKAIQHTFTEMVSKGGRDTERDLYGCSGGYKTKLSKNTVDTPCPYCGEVIRKEAYMGGSIYICERCQKK